MLSLLTNLINYFLFYLISFFSNAWYLDISITKFAHYVCYSGLVIFYYTVDKGIIYFFGPEGLVTFFLFISRKISNLQSGVISSYVQIIFFLFFLFCILLLV